MKLLVAGLPDNVDMIDLGVGTLTEWRRHGVSHAELRRGLQLGTFTQLRRSWYAINGADPAAVEAVSKGGAIGCLSALGYHRVWMPPQPHRLHLRGNGHAHRIHPGRYCTQFGGRPQPVRSVLDEPLTALRHALRCLDPEGITVVCDSLLNTSRRALAGEPVTEILTAAEVASAFEGAPARIVACLHRCDARAASGTETMVRLRLRSRNVKVIVQAHVPGLGHVDLLVGERLLIEVDSKQHHTGIDSYREDRRRDQVAARLGLLRMRLTYENVVYEWPQTEIGILSTVRNGHHRAPRRFRQA